MKKIINSLPEECTDKIHANALKEVQKHWVSARKGTGRKKLDKASEKRKTKLSELVNLSQELGLYD